MPTKLLHAFALTESIFIDANIFLFHAFNDRTRGAEATGFLRRVEMGALRAVTSALVLDEVFFKISQQEAASLLGRPAIWHIKDRLVKDPSFRLAMYKPVLSYRTYIELLMSRGMSVLDVTADHMLKAAEIAGQEGLLITDAVHVAVMREHRIVDLATDDKDLWRVSGLTAWAPQRVQTAS